MENQDLVELMRSVIKEELQPITDRLDKMDSRLDKIEDRLGILEVKSDMTHGKIDNVEFAMKVLERNLTREINLLKDGQEMLITVLEAKDILPKVEGQ